MLALIFSMTRPGFPRRLCFMACEDAIACWHVPNIAEGFAGFPLLLASSFIRSYGGRQYASSGFEGIDVNYLSGAAKSASQGAFLWVYRSPPLSYRMQSARLPTEICWSTQDVQKRHIQTFMKKECWHFFFRNVHSNHPLLKEAQCSSQNTWLIAWSSVKLASRWLEPS